jgi:hypothetical protein
MEDWKVENGRLTMEGRPGTGDGRPETGEKLFSVHDGDPPFVGDEAEALIVSEQMFGFQGFIIQVFPPNTQPPIWRFYLQF